MGWSRPRRCETNFAAFFSCLTLNSTDSSSRAGISVRFCTFAAASEQVWHVLVRSRNCPFTIPSRFVTSLLLGLSRMYNRVVLPKLQDSNQTQILSSELPKSSSKTPRTSTASFRFGPVHSVFLRIDTAFSYHTMQHSHVSVNKSRCMFSRRKRIVFALLA